MPEFNLIREPWICCVDRHGQVRAAGLAELFASSHDISEIADESPLVVAALHRLILAIVHRNFGPRNTEAWGELWRLGRFSAGVLEAYWEKWEPCFDLFDDTHPFYQSASITECDEPRTAGVLEFQRSSGINATLADHTTDHRSPAMTPAEAARALVTHQAFALGGTVGYLKTCEKDADKHASDAPSARGAVCLLRGPSLFQTLMLNLAAYDPAAHQLDLPCWEVNPSQGRGERTPRGRVDLFTWQSRRSRLFVSGSRDGPVRVDRVKLVPGFHVPLLWDPFAVESMQSFIIKSDAKPEERPWFQYRITTERAIWRDSSAILYGIAGRKMRTVTLDWVAQLLADRELPNDFVCCVDVLGFATDQQKVRLWRREELPTTAGLLQDQRCRESLRAAIGHADDTDFALTATTEKLAAEVLAPHLGQNGNNSPDSGRVRQLARSLGGELEYWSSLAGAFHEFLESLGASQRLAGGETRDNAQDAAFDAWKDHVRSAALDAFRGASSGIAQTARGLRAQAIAETELRRRLASVARKLMGGDGAGDRR